MPSISGTTDPLIRPDVFAHLPGRTVGLGWPFTQGNYPFVAVPLSTSLAGAATAGGGSGASKSTGTQAGTTDQDVTYGSFWFGHVHALPRSKIDFGNIITQVDKPYEVYNAFRDTDVALSSVTNNALPGTELPSVSPPLVIRRQTSMLDSSTTDNSGGTGLGTLVQTSVRALADGLPTFDTNIIFVTDQNDPQILVTGTRIILIPQEYEADAKETLAFLTDIISSLDGKEQRIALRKQPRQLFEVLYKLNGNDRQRMQALLMDWMDNVFGFPLWHEQLRLTSGVSAGATTYPVSGASDVDLRVGGLAVVITDANTFDVINISALSDTQITAADPSVNAYAAGTRIMPLRIARIRRAIPSGRPPYTLETYRITFEVSDNDTGALTGSTTPGFWSLYNSRVLFDDCNVMDGSMSQEFQRRVYVLDNLTGIVDQTSTWDRYKRTHAKGFVARSRAEIIQLRKVLLALRGRQTAFYIPTFIEDLEVKATLSSGSSTMDIENIGYERFIMTRLPKTIFRITFTDGTSLVRIVQSVANVDATTERLTLDTTWPATRTVSEISRVEFYELVRFATDAFVLTYPRMGLATMQAQVSAAFDDN